MTLLITDSFPRGLGYLEIDQRNVEAELPLGTPRLGEYETYTCKHCNRIVVKHPMRVRERYKCSTCGNNICDPCAAAMATGAMCKTMQQRVEEELERVSRLPEPSSIILP